MRTPSQKMSVTVIRFSVSVPVLSEQMTLTQPMVSQATSFFTNAFFFDILMTLMASETATIVGRRRQTFGNSGDD